MREQHLKGVGDAGPQTGDEREHRQDTVSIKINDKPVDIHRGRQTVAEIKRLGGVPAADELAQATEGQPLKPLADDGSVVIKGGEEFVSYPKDSSSSFAGPVE
jgi:hypothetical protein